MDNTLTIIIPNYNKGIYLGKAIDSILEQSHLPDEIIIIDDASTDNSVDVIKHYYSLYPSLIKPLFLPDNHGVQCCRNLGILNAKGHFVCFVDSDDVYLSPLCIEKQIQYASDKLLVGIYTQTIDKNGAITSKAINNKEKRRFRRHYSYYMYNLMDFMLWPYHYIVSKERVISVGMFDNPYGLYEDNEMVIKLIHSGLKIKWINLEGRGYRNDELVNHLSRVPIEKHQEAINYLKNKYLYSLPSCNQRYFRIYSKYLSLRSSFKHKLLDIIIKK